MSHIGPDRWLRRLAVAGLYGRLSRSGDKNYGTVPDTYAESHLANTVVTPGAAANQAARGLGRGLCPLPRKFLGFWYQNGEFLCILGGIINHLPTCFTRSRSDRWCFRTVTMQRFSNQILIWFENRCMKWKNNVTITIINKTITHYYYFCDPPKLTIYTTYNELIHNHNAACFVFSHAYKVKSSAFKT